MADAIITTEKDAVKISQPPGFPLLVAVQATEVANAGAFKLALKTCVEERA
jgi:tetraacyldisaccharide-1-P 4'-kinase